MKEEADIEKEKEEEVTLSQLEGYTLQLNQLYEQNINLRMKYPTEPMRFYQSEEEIDNILQSMQVVGQEHIPFIIQSNVLGAILRLINHPNEDINISCIEFLHELVSEEPDKDQLFEIYYRMCVWLIENGIYECLVETLSKMNEEESVEEYEVSLKILKVLETLTEQMDSSIETLVTDTKIMEYLSNRIMPNYLVKHKVIDDNKYVGSDILALLLSNSEKAQLSFHLLSGMEILLESIHPFLSKVPSSSDEGEYLGNLFDCLNIMLINGSEDLLKSRIVYHQMKGNEVMLQFIKAKSEYGVHALKTIANSFTAIDADIEALMIEEFIDFGGLKYIFPIILRQGLRGKEIDEQMDIDENCLRIVLVMIASTSEAYKVRVEAKFTEKRFAKLQKLFEVRAEYMQNIGKEALKEVGAQEYFQKLKEGLGVAEIIDKIICNLVTCTSTVRHKLVVLMKLYGVLAEDVEFTLKSKYSFIGENAEKTHLERLLAENMPLLRSELGKEVKPSEE